MRGSAGVRNPAFSCKPIACVNELQFRSRIFGTAHYAIQQIDFL